MVGWTRPRQGYGRLQALAPYRGIGLHVAPPILSQVWNITTAAVQLRSLLQREVMCTGVIYFLECFFDAKVVYYDDIWRAYFLRRILILRRFCVVGVVP